MEKKRQFFTADEKDMLKELVEKYKIVESKKSDCISASNKKKAWVAICHEFNAIETNTHRYPEQLKKCWENMKMKRKLDLADEKKERMGTGGGPYVPPRDDINNVDDILQTVDIELEDVIDNDTITMAEMGNDLHYGITNKEELFKLDGGTYIDENGSRLTASPKIEGVLPTVRTPRATTSRPPNNSRGTAIDRELQERLKRNTALMVQDRELHELKIAEQKIKNIEAEVRLKIAEELLKQEVYRTQLLLKEGQDSQ